MEARRLLTPVVTLAMLVVLGASTSALATDTPSRNGTNQASASLSEPADLGQPFPRLTKSATAAPQADGPIIADHTVVDQYDDIPQEYIDEVKQMWFNLPGESHSRGYRNGVRILQSLDSRFQVNVTDSGAPEAYTDQHLRVSQVTRSASGWYETYGEANWYTNASAITRTKNHLDYCNTHNLEIAAIGFGWCWDMTWHNSPGGGLDPVHQVHWAGASEGGPDGDLRWGLDAEDYELTGNHVSLDTYLSATQEYVDYVKAQGYPTVVFFTTGPVDGYSGESGYQRYLKHERIRDYVKASSDLVLFDYADILSWNDAEAHYTMSWTDYGGTPRTYEMIHPDNMNDFDPTDGDPSGGDHIGDYGELRLAKAVWWMLARIAGWDGSPGPYKMASAQTATHGQAVTYTVVIRNTSIPSTTTLYMSDTLPAGLTYIPGTLSATGGIADDSGAPGLHWSGTLNLAPVVTVTYAATVTAAEPQAIVNTARIAAAGYEGITSTATITVKGGSRVSDQSGNWSTPSTWEGDVVPVASDAVTITAGTTVTLDTPAQCYSLTVAHGATLIIPDGVALTVTAGLINQGTLQQTHGLNNAGFAFLEIGDYRGATITSTHNLGSVTVRVRALAEGESCTSAGPSASYARRCFEIVAQNSDAATLRLWALTTELDNSLTLPRVFRYVAPDWVELEQNVASGVESDYTFAQANTPGFSHFLMAQSGSTPTAVGQRALDVPGERPPAWLLAIPALALAGSAAWKLGRLWRQRARNRV